MDTCLRPLAPRPHTAPQTPLGSGTIFEGDLALGPACRPGDGLQMAIPRGAYPSLTRFCVRPHLRRPAYESVRASTPRMTMSTLPARCIHPSGQIARGHAY